MFFSLIQSFLSDAGRYILVFLEETWWFLVFFPLVGLTINAWLYFRQTKFKRAEQAKHTMLEILIPREVTKEPRGMEQVLRALHGLPSAPGNIFEEYLDGEVPGRFALEMVSFGGEVHFYVRTLSKLKHMVEAVFVSHYPDVEIVEVEDYMKKLPRTVGEAQAKGLDVWASELVLAREDAYPIKTYVDFEEIEEGRQFDPISTLLELFGKAKPEEFAAVQINIQPLPPLWRKQWDGLVDKLRREGTSASGGDEEGGFLLKSPGQINVLKAVEHHLSHPAFKALVRLMYISPKALLYGGYARKGLANAFNQYGSIDLNSFRHNYAMWTFVSWGYKPFFFAGTRNDYRKNRLLYLFRERLMPEETFMGRLLTSNFFRFNPNFHSKTIQLTVEELATIFHPPTRLVLTAPHIKRVESRKMGPPAGLPILGDDRALEKFT